MRDKAEIFWMVFYLDVLQRELCEDPKVLKTFYGKGLSSLHFKNVFPIILNSFLIAI